MLPVSRTIIPDVVRDQRLATLPSSATVSAAAKLMAERRMGAVLIVDDGKLVGIVTERDIAVRVVAAGLDAAATRLGKVMTPKPDTLKPTDTVRAALDLMARRGYRHLPVLRRGKLVGMVSIRDLYRSVVDQLEADILMLAEGLVQG
jgi:CBS domain-containing protein